MSEKGLVSRIYSELSNLNNKKGKHSLKKGPKSWSDTSQRRCRDNKQGFEKIPNVIWQRNAKIMCNEVSLHMCKND